MVRMGRFAVLALVITLVLAATSIFQPARAEQEPGNVTIFAAASLKNALDELTETFAKSGGVRAVISYAASSALAKQIEAGAPADVFASADIDWMDYLAGKNLIDAQSRVNLLGNELVIVAPAASSVQLAVGPGFDLAGALGDGRLAVANTQSAPAGKYAKAALMALGVWNSVEAKLAQGENVRSALMLVALGEAPLGIVYRSDAVAEAKVKVVASFPTATHPAIVYPFAVTTAAARPAHAKALLAYLATAEAQEVFRRHGFQTNLSRP